MILKVRNTEGHWKYYEGFYAVEIQELWLDDKATIDADEIFHAPKNIGITPGVVPPKAERIVLAKLSYPSNMTIAFDTGGYLLNYEGKTIEKL